MPHVAHLTSAHPRSDVRIFHKMCRTLASHSYRISLVVADGIGDRVVDRVSILDSFSPRSRLDRIINSPKHILLNALDTNADLYHLHDPELLPIGLKLKQLGKRVIFDSHEDAPLQMLSKPYLNRVLRSGISYFLRLYEAWVCRQFDGIIAATPFIRNKFLRLNPNTIDINNYPILSELATSASWSEKQPEVCYVGAIAEIRGIAEVVKALGLLRSSSRLNLVGRFGDLNLQNKLESQPVWRRVNSFGVLDRSGVRDVLARSIAGIVTFHPLPNHIHAQPNKLFEYMSAGIPVIASDFPLWREIVAGNQCGLLVDPLNPAEIAEAIDYLIYHPVEAEKMGRNGLLAIQNGYNWNHEAQKLMVFYDTLLSRSGFSSESWTSSG
jgi:glycosyltransferase involved in cell wall biosynthesis